MPDYADWPEPFPPVTHFIDEQDNPKPWIILMDHPDYEAAKNHEDLDAAQRLVRRFLDTPWARNCLENIIREYPGAIITAIHAAEKNGKNKIPVTLAHNIAEITGLEEDDSIIQTNLVKRTGNDAIYRLAFRPQFDGQVRTNRGYILIDDVFSNGGSFSELRQYIIRQGGNVLHTASMTTGGHGNVIALSPKTRLDLEHKFGVESLIDFCKECNLYGGNYKALTEPEAFFLARSPSLDALRNQIAQARQESFNRIPPQDVQEPQAPDRAVTPAQDHTNLHSPEARFNSMPIQDTQVSFDFSPLRPANAQEDFIHKTIIKTAENPGVFSIIGKKIPLLKSGRPSKRGWKELYNVLSRYRDKQYETFRYLFIDSNGQIADHVALSQRNPASSPTGSTEYPDEYFFHLMAAYADNNNYGIVFCHNHPGGNPNPSDNDKNITKFLEKNLGPRFGGHIILDHGNFSVCENGNDWIQVNSGQYNKDPLIENKPDSFFGINIKSSRDLNLVKAALQVDGGHKWNDADWIPVVFTNAQSIITSLHYYRKSDFTRHDARLFIINKTVNISNMTGSTRAFPITDDPHMFDILRNLNNKIHLFTDFYVNGKTRSLTDDEQGSIKHYLNQKTVYVDSTFPIPPKPAHETGNLLDAAEMTLASPQPRNDGYSLPRNALLKWGAVNTPTLHKALVTLNNNIENSPAYKKKKITSLKKERIGLLKKLSNIYFRLERNSFDKIAFESSINAVFGETSFQNIRHDLVYFGHVPNILVHTGLPNSSLYMDSTHLYTSMKDTPSISNGNSKHINYHDIPLNTMKKIPDALQNPLLVLQSKHYPASLVAVLNLYDKDDNPIIVPITPFRKSFIDSTELRYNKISSIYGKSDISHFLYNHQDMILYADKNRSRLFQPRERQSPRAAWDHLNSGFYENNIQHYKNCVKGYVKKTGIVNPDFLAEPETPYGSPLKNNYSPEKPAPEGPERRKREIFVQNAYVPGTEVPKFAGFTGNTFVSYEGFRFARTENANQIIILRKAGRETAVSAALYNSILANTLPLIREKHITPEIIEKYEKAINADTHKTRANTTANYWHNFRVLSRGHASTPAETMEIAKSIIRQMPCEEQEKFKAHIKLYEHTSQPPETYNARILTFFQKHLQTMPADISIPSRNSIPGMNRHVDVAERKGARFDPNLEIKIGDSLNPAVKLDGLLAGKKQNLCAKNMILVSASNSLNKVVLMDKETKLKYVLDKDKFSSHIQKPGKNQRRIVRNKQTCESAGY
jgi:proteasome lid subunit RPN8/RPN11